MIDISSIRNSLQEAHIRPQTQTRVESLLQALNSLLEDVSIEQIHEGLTHGQILLPGAGEGGDVAVIPGKGWGSCVPIVLAIAKGRDGRSPLAVPRVMRDVRAYLISCFEIAEVVILLTDRWDPNLLEESAGDFSAYASRLPNGKVLIPIVAWKRQLTSYDWP